MDRDPSNWDNVITIYTQRSDPASSSGDTTGWNREHLWPQSYGVFADGPDTSDLHALRASDWNVNSARNNLVRRGGAVAHVLLPPASGMHLTHRTGGASTLATARKPAPDAPLPHTPKPPRPPPRTASCSSRLLLCGVTSRVRCSTWPCGTTATRCKTRGRGTWSSATRRMRRGGTWACCLCCVRGTRRTLWTTWSGYEMGSCAGSKATETRSLTTQSGWPTSIGQRA